MLCENLATLLCEDCRFAGEKRETRAGDNKFGQRSACSFIGSPSRKCETIISLPGGSGLARRTMHHRTLRGTSLGTGEDCR